MDYIEARPGQTTEDIPDRLSWFIDRACPFPIVCGSAIRGGEPDITKFNNSTLKRPIIIAVIIELLTVPVAILTTGHAGPEGPLADLGWLGVLVNLPGFLVVGMIIPNLDSILVLAVIAAVVNGALLTGLFVLVSRLWARRK